MTDLATELVAPLTAELAAAVDRAVRAGAPTEPAAATARRVAEALAGFLHHPDLLSPAHLEPDPHCYRQHVLHVAPDGAFSVVALVWLPGQATPVHDHTTWCVVGTYVGEEEETSFRIDPALGTLVPLETTVNPAGTVAHLAPPGDIHVVRNATTGLAVSIHVYGTDVRVHGTSIRRRYAG